MVASIRAMPGDTLLRLMTWGLARHRLGQFDASNVALEAADRLAEDRYTKSIRQQIGTALISDNIADYVPGAHERAFLHYYGMLNYLQLGDQEGALVEARRANQFLSRYARENGARSFTIDGTVEYVAGLLHLGAGDRNDAIISFRKANHAFGSYEQHYGISAPRFVGVDLARIATRMGAEDVLRTTTREFKLTPDEISTQPGHGTLMVLVENGSVARRVEQKVYFPVLEGEADALKSGGVGAALTVGLPIASRTLNLLSEVSNTSRGYGRPYQDGILLAGVERGADFVTMAWPKYVLEQTGAKDITVVVDSLRERAVLMEDLSAIAARAFEEERPRVLQRMVFRGLAKYALAKAAESKAEEQGGMFLGMLAKVVTQGAAAHSESADVRSWSALPGEIRAVRLSLPAGVHHVTVEIADADGIPRSIELGPVSIEPGKLVVRSQFVTGTWAGATERFATAVQKVDFRAAQDTMSGITLADNLAADTLTRVAFTGRRRDTDVKPKKVASRTRSRPASRATAGMNGRMRVSTKASVGNDVASVATVGVADMPLNVTASPAPLLDVASVPARATGVTLPVVPPHRQSAKATLAARRRDAAAAKVAALATPAVQAPPPP